ncbi:MAG: DUF134 domain-containing protein [bacterium]|nr:DUF134 domain-containing protein [bacterium]
MGRPVCRRRIAFQPAARVFKPAGIPGRCLDEEILSLDELEALRLADLEGQYQEAAAAEMGVSRGTFGRIIETARRKVASALVNGYSIRITGGHVTMTEYRRFQCSECGHDWNVPFGTDRPEACPACKSQSIQRVEEEAVSAGRGGGRGCCHRGGHGNGGGRGQGRRGARGENAS